MDFVEIRATAKTGRGKVETTIVYPEFVVSKFDDIMIRGGSFYAFWDDRKESWTFDEIELAKRIDELVDEKASEFDGSVKKVHVRDYTSGKWTQFQNFVKSLPDNYVPMDTRVVFSDEKVGKHDYMTKCLPYALSDQSTPAWDELVDVLYDSEEREKLEWAIGSVFKGDSKRIQKFIVLYGSAGSGKSTILNIIQMLFEGYYCVFESKALGTSSASFALSQFNSNPLVAIEHDGDLSKVEDNTRLNSIVSHEEMVVNEKYKSAYTMRIDSFLFIGTNRPVRITDAKSGIMRRLIYVQPSNRHIPFEKYVTLMNQIAFELGGIARKCMDTYERLGMSYYDGYRPVEMMGFTNDFYNYVEDCYEQFARDDSVTLKAAWEAYKLYCDDANVKYPYSKRVFKSELRNYFASFDERKHITNADGTTLNVYNYYSGFLKDKFARNRKAANEFVAESNWIELGENESAFDSACANCLAQPATDKGTPKAKWEFVDMELRDLDPHILHYVLVPGNHIVIDFDLKDENGEKSLERNIQAAEKLPRTYAEVSKSGGGLHLHYIYDGDVSKLARVYDDNVEIKVFSGNSSLRRKLTLCNTEPIAHISSGLPLRREDKVIDFEGLKNEKALRTTILRNLEKKYHPGTKPSVEFIKKVLDDAYENGMSYDVTDLRPNIMDFALNSTHHSGYCTELVSKMRFRSEEEGEHVPYDEKDIVFYDVEVFPNLFVVVWKRADSEELERLSSLADFDGKEFAYAIEELKESCVCMVNPKPAEIEELCKLKLVGFNNRKYDNHILFARMMGYSESDLFELSSRIVGNDPNSTFIDAYNLSYADVYDFSSLKQSLKKFEIDLGIHHQELGLPWDKPVDRGLWLKVAEYCRNDVVATEATFVSRQSDFRAREILASVSGLTVNHTNRQHTERIIFGNDRNPQKQFLYTDLATGTRTDGSKDVASFDGYSYEYNQKTRKCVSTYRGEEVGEGGYVYAEPGYYENVALLDVESMHPSSIILLDLFGPKYTKRFEELKAVRVAVKKKDYDSAGKMLDGKLAPFLGDEAQSKDLAYALKIVINSVYGLTAARFPNKFRDDRNKDNIVAKRGALFMIDLKHEVQERGFTVAHIKTDSIKIPNATPEIIDFVISFGKSYGYNFVHEATYDKMCLVNDAVYIARQAEDSNEDPGEWCAVGKQFQVPYVFKTLFTHDPITFEDLCVTHSVSGNGYLVLDMNETLPDVTDYEKLKSALSKDPEKLTKSEKRMLEGNVMSEGEIDDRIAEGHEYLFVGKSGSFCPVKFGSGGGILLRESDGRHSAVSDTKGFRWMESETLRNTNKEGEIDKSYFTRLVDDAIDSIGKHCDANVFVA